MHLDFRRQNSTCPMLVGVGEQGKNTRIRSIGYDTLESLLLPEIEDENDNAVEEDNLSSKLSGIDGYAAQMDYPFKELGLMRIPEVPQRYSYSVVKQYAFVYDPMADDYKFMIAVSSEKETSLVHVYSLVSDSWKSFLVPYIFILSYQKSGVLFNGDLHWLAFCQSKHCIVSLDVGNEKFKEIQPPSECLKLILVGVLEKCLCVLVEDENDAIDIWAMQVYGDPKSWNKHYSITHEIITSRLSLQYSFLRFMWSFKNGIILFMDSSNLVLYDPNHGTAIERRLSHISVENYSESLVSLNSGTYVQGTTVNNVKGRTVNSAYVELQIVRKKNSVLEARNAELETRDGQLVASNAELHRKLHESQVAYQNLEQHVNAQDLPIYRQYKPTTDCLELSLVF
ncbi:F-box protein CPR1-like [Papaver somniferum]|uniref:F-box protein CPR1-like n=1 Tax=Papaver somniferum TaxID=3469 RepID=UPI000E6F52C0|nr:F-box protein CPR1-like [Papaver somniferum]